MNILQVYQVFNSNAPSGVAKVAYDISSSLAKRGHKVVFYASDMEDWFTRGKSGSFVARGIKVRLFKTIGTVLTRKLKIYVTPSLIMSHNEVQKYDVIHLHGYISFQSIIIHYFAKKYNIPYVVQAHGSIPRIGKRLLKLVYDVVFGYRLLRDASKVIALTEVEAKDYEQMGVPRNKIAIVPNGIDLCDYSRLPPQGSFKKKFDISRDEKVILYLGRIHEIKGVDILVRAFAGIKNKLHYVKLVIAGPDDGYSYEIATMVKDLKIAGEVQIIGPLYGNRKIEALVDADIFALPSRYEVFPLTLLEAVACHTPIITTTTCQISDRIENNVGMSVNPDSESFAEGLMKMLADKSFYDTLKRNCENMAETFDISKVVDKLEQIYVDVAEKTVVQSYKV